MRAVVLFAAIVMIAAVGVLFFKILKRRKAQPPKTPYETAREALGNLKMRSLASKNDVKAFYEELSHIVRRYLEERFGLRAPEMTTEEFLIKAKETDKLSREDKLLLKEFLVHCDLVKFAKYGPSRKEIDSSLDSAEKLVESTKEKEPEAEK